MDLQARILILGLLAFCHFYYSEGTLLYKPEQIHIAAGASVDQMIIVWNTGNDTQDSRVIVFDQSGQLHQEAKGTSHVFVDQGNEHRTQYVHTVNLTGLEPNTEYQFICGSVAYGWSEEFTFRTWPAGTKWSPRLAIFGDMGTVNAQSLTRLELDTYSGMYDGILHVGDFAYDMNVENARVGDEFMRQIQPIATRLPYMTCPGNHEQEHNFLNYRSRFYMPGDENKQMYYTFTMGPVRFISLATELFFFPQYGLVPIVEHYKWLHRTLEEANKPENRAKHPWIITFGHRPMYCSNNDRDDCTNSESLVRVGIPFLHYLSWEQLFNMYGVDLAIWAHEHSYERLWPIYNREMKNGSYDQPYTNPRGPVHIITGSAGCQENHDGFKKEPEAWSAFRSLDYGYTRMAVLNSTHLYLEQVSDDKGGAIIDKMMLIQEHHGSFQNDTKPFKPKGKHPIEKLWKVWKPHMEQAKKLFDKVKVSVFN